ncbi:hypothetical protein F4809DRAFT_264543 [Biscogniauxia mediterranea]|nr:hypothetical protein F4809DRAFT_264543 [Biscogniauxia mediterranea]
MAYRHSEDDLAYGERWDVDRFVNESGRKRQGGERERFEEHDRVYTRPPPRDRVRDKSVDGRFERRAPRPWDDDYVVREKKFYEEEPRFRRSPPPELERRVVFERERGRRDYHSPSPPPRVPPRVPTLVRRQSSLDSYDRRPLPRFYDRDEHSPPPPSRRSDYRPEPYQPIPLPRSRALPPPRVYAERDYEEIKISEPDRYGDEEFHAYPERVRERSVVRSKRRRDRSSSRTSRSRTHRSSTMRSNSRSSTTSSSSSSSSSGGATTVTVKSEYPKKGKTRIPAKLVSKRAIIDLGYPFIEEGSTIVIQKALGQQNIDDLLKSSEDYKKSELEVAAARSVPGFDDRRDEVFTIPPPPAAPPAPVAAMPPTPTFVHTPPPPAPPPAPTPQYHHAPEYHHYAPEYNHSPVEVVKDTLVVRDSSPTRSYRSRRSRSTSTSTRTPYVLDAVPREYSDDLAVGPLALVSDRRRSDKEIKMEIARLEAERELRKREKSRHRHRSHSHSRDREVVRAERLPTGELVVYEEQVEKVEEPRRGVRIEKDKKGRMTISVPKYR